ncbi:hypothetical protein [Nonomuraea cavernae]|uniref:Uncharacterized protein n=1 Tax=Nonomuraea cavernae TaxID=2045107 RepID=A0A918DJ08_9ACTN|nr:hypothetical protein [Nonomuraea cavernae]MCA2186302.1 hypothetical protein [Nonomuraea cavernae]GGO69598.1 hypothetical protein GCM10012289_31070 [Nonomuraea cavernae]
MGSKMKRALQVAALGGIMAGGLALPATAAQAQPTNCVTTSTSRTFSVSCHAGTGEYQAEARCYKPGNPVPTLRYGQWRSGGEKSIASCQFDEELRDGRVRFR